MRRILQFSCAKQPIAAPNLQKSCGATNLQCLHRQRHEEQTCNSRPGTTRWAPTASSSSSTRRPTRPRSARCSRRWASPRSRKHRHKNVTLYRQGDVNFIINAEPDSFAQRFARQHGPSVCAMAFRVKDADARLRARARTGRLGLRQPDRPDGAEHPGDQGHRRLADLLRRPLARQGRRGSPARSATSASTTSTSCRSPGAAGRARSGNGLTYIDHLTHNVHRGRMKEWADFYERLFNFREVRYFDIEGKLTGLKSKAMTSPCGKIRIPINESSDDKSQIAEYLDLYHGEGIQHIALGTDDIYATVDGMKQQGVAFQDTIDTYYDLVDRRLPDHGENLDELQAPAHPDRRRHAPGRAERTAAADLHADGDRADLLRDHPAQGRPGLRRRQLPRAVREHRARPGAARRAEGRAAVALIGSSPAQHAGQNERTERHLHVRRRGHVDVLCAIEHRRG